MYKVTNQTRVIQRVRSEEIDVGIYSKILRTVQTVY